MNGVDTGKEITVFDKSKFREAISIYHTLFFLFSNRNILISTMNGYNEFEAKFRRSN